MNGIFISQCCGCAKKKCVTHKDEFTSYYNLLRYQLADTPGGSTSVSVDGWDPGVSVSLGGEGSFTVDIAAPTAALEVGSLITSLGVGASAGVTVRRADSSDNISLWWLGGTSWELRQGSTVLESIVNAAGAFKLVLKTPLDPTTDVEVWIGGSLVHTESAVAFVAPSELWHVGLIVDGEAAFQYLETTPCPKIIDCEPPGGCLPTVGTVEPPIVPVVWSFSVPAIANLPGDTECDLWGDDDFVLVNKWASVGYDYFDSNQWRTPIQAIQNVDPLPGDAEVYPLGCEWIAVIPSFDHRVFECSGEVPPAVPPGKLPVKWITCAFGNAAGNHPTSAGTLGPAWMLTLQYRNLGTILAPDMEYRVWLSKQDVVGSTADYVGAWVKYNAADIISGAFVLSLVQNSGCDDLPATITVTAGGEDAIARRVLECWDTACTPPVTPVPGVCYIVDITMIDDNGSSWRWVTPTGASFNEATGSWEWTGTGIGYANYVHDDCGALPSFDVKIHCVELEEGSEKQWVMDINTTTATSRLTFEWFGEPNSLPGWTGTTNIMCSGETWDVYAIGPNMTSDSDYTFGSCSWSACVSPNSLVFGGGISVSCYNNISDPPLTADGYLLFTPTDDLPVGVSPGSVNGMVYRAILPSNLTGGDASSVFLFVQSGSAMVYIVDANLNLVADMFASIGYTCDPSDGKAVLDDTSPIPYYWGSPNPQLTDPFGLCNAGDGNGDWSITFW